MNKEKRSRYELKGSFHTLEVKSPFAEQDGKREYISTRFNGKKEIATSKINPNKYDSDIFTFSEFQDVFNEILKESNIDEYRITRADMRFDNYDESNYLAFAKLNKYIISALAVTYQVKNRYKTVELFSDRQLSICIKNDYFECENYDRKQKNEVTGNDTEQAKARLEERTTAKQWHRLNGGNYFDTEWNMKALKKEFTKGWEERWNKARQNLKLVQEMYNDELVKKYYKGKNARPVQFRSLTDFLISNQDNIFTSMQMVDLLKRLDVPNPESRAKYHKKKYGIEYFSQKDVDFAIKEIKRATKEYFKN